jgi:hypothetical protein
LKHCITNLDGFDYDVLDSIFVTYPTLMDGKLSMCVAVIKRKGNKQLRKHYFSNKSTE